MERIKMPRVKRSPEEKIAALQAQIQNVQRMQNRSGEQRTLDGAIRSLKRARKVIADELVLDAVDACLDALNRARG